MHRIRVEEVVTVTEHKQRILTQKEYQQMAKANEPKRPVLANCVRAFLVGGIICLIGQGITDFYIFCFGFTEKSAGNPTAATLIFLSVLLTSLGVYDHIAQWAGAGTAVPVTGFANSMASAALEHRTEGYVLGVGSNMFKLAGSVIVFGVFSAFVIALIRTLIAMIGGV
ncbi:MAG: stage V sporulation protein AC [Limnochordia bacterium]|jgi:stage V sporulation protein AC|nr:stage V sporulation protein AC [Bacillota bacterium]HOB08927.1 stage V sporulation protein AC [Limnochordia bacterium]NLH31874.1 stage V sporulation protein AC [Bacillota bacterium]HPT93189.1 stage V sporulation protein AC [Limnochordia bacterium]HPZ31085.1 stage V sporulation protein AC [Limnochordia bacterium]